MASLKTDLDLSNKDQALDWLDIFDAKCKHKKIEDNPAENMKTMYFLSSLTVPTFSKVKTITAPVNPKTMTFEDLAKALRKFLNPKEKLTIA